MPAVLRLDHVQLAMPSGREGQARAFYVDLLGFAEIAKPAILAARGGLWLSAGAAQLHLGIEEPFAPARKAHPALLVDDLGAFRERLQAAGFATAVDEALAGYDRFYVSDPFGNRIELMQRLLTSAESVTSAGAGG